MSLQKAMRLFWVIMKTIICEIIKIMLHTRVSHEKLGPELHDWIKNLPLYIEDKKFLAVHAGLQPNNSLKDTPRRILLNIRTWDGEGKDLNNPKFRHGTRLTEGNAQSFMGIGASQGLCLRRNTFGLDSACVYGGSLSGYVLERS